MKMLLATALALGALSTAASAQWCPPGAGYGHGFHRPHASATRVIVQAPVAPAEAPAAPIEPAPLPAQPEPEAAPPK